MTGEIMFMISVNLKLKNVLLISFRFDDFTRQLFDYAHSKTKSIELSNIHHDFRR